MKFAILAPGNIAHKMAEAVSALEEVELYAVASRDYGRAKAFADQWGFEKAYGSYEDLVKDPQVELVYVASPHSHHFEHVRLCLAHGKNVLVEKAFTVNAAQAEELIRMAEDRGLLLAEAIWTRYMPSKNMINDLLQSGVIGEAYSLTANLGYVMTGKERLKRPELAGGALLDVGVYPINFAMMVFGERIEKIISTAVLSPEGVDWMNSMTLTFEGGQMAVLHSSMVALTDRLGVIYGNKGFIEVQNINNCEEIRVLDLEREVIARYKAPKQVNGYEYEVLACIKAIREGRTECEAMPHAQTLRVMKVMDAMRHQWGMSFPCE